MVIVYYVEGELRWRFCREVFFPHLVLATELETAGRQDNRGLYRIYASELLYVVEEVLLIAFVEVRLDRLR